MENMDRAPYLCATGRWGYRMGAAEIYDAMLRDGLDDAFSGKHSGWHTEDLVAFAGEPSRRARPLGRTLAAPVLGGAVRRHVRIRRDRRTSNLTRKGTRSLTNDERTRPDTTLASPRKLARLPQGGTITAGNAPGLTTGAAAMIVANRSLRRDERASPLGRLVAYGVGAVGQDMFGIGPIPAVRQALDRAGWKTADIQRIEINEAFAAIAIAVTKDLGLSEDVVNVEGGAIAHGHPIGATGAVLTTRLLHSMQRDGLKRGVVTLCIGGGQGIALAFEAMK